ncbi:MAG: outer membrane beta-barrel protein [Taibaiella sp.]|nr:outer membrane beta-barrel protein [Taibaiella sp.]
MRLMKIAFGIAMSLSVVNCAKGIPDSSAADVAAVTSEPYAWGDFTWVQGGSRLPVQVLSSKYFTGDMTMDINYNYNFAHPIDHTQSGSTACFRTDEINVSYIEAGGDFHDPQSGARGRLMLQFGSRATGVPRNDVTPLRGQYDLHTAMRYVTEGYVGMHFKKMHGINVDLGIFKSYVGLMGYNNFENWNYQNSFTSDNTPWFFTGLRVQTFPTDRLKVEYWIVNGWQTYAMANGVPGLGVQIDYRPREWLKVLASAYYGHDAALYPTRSRFHSDNSVIVRYCNRPGRFLRRGAFSVTGDIGFENGAGVRPFNDDPGSGVRAQNFLSYMVYHRWWLGKEGHFAWTVGGGQLHNPGRYLALLPAGAGVLTQNPGDQLDCWDASTGVQFMPNDHVTFGIEYVERHASAPYFSGHGGVTSPNGWNDPIGNPSTPGWAPDLVKDEHRVILSMITRF